MQQTRQRSRSISVSHSASKRRTTGSRSNKKRAARLGDQAALKEMRRSWRASPETLRRDPECASPYGCHIAVGESLRLTTSGADGILQIEDYG